MPRGVKKQDLPEKTCASCGLPFAWRKKWAREWDSVRYCSERCKSAGKTRHSSGKDEAASSGH